MDGCGSRAQLQQAGAMKLAAVVVVLVLVYAVAMRSVIPLFR